MTKANILGVLLFLSSGFEFSTAFASQSNYKCEIKLVSSNVSPTLFRVGDHMKVSTDDPTFILPEFTHSDGSLSSWNKQSHPTFFIQNNTPTGFQIVFARKYVSGDFVEENSIEIEKALSSSQTFGAWVHFSTTYGSVRKELIKMYATCSTYLGDI